MFDIEAKLVELEEAKRRLVIKSNIEPARRPKIQCVPAYLRQREEFAKYYTPQKISFGPIHHCLKLGEDYKLMWAGMYIEDTEQRATDLLRKIKDNIEELKELYTEDIVKHYDDEYLTWMLFLDGCSVLQILRTANRLDPSKLNVKFDELTLVERDLFLLENQLPFQVLKLLCDGDETWVVRYMYRFLLCRRLEELPTQLPDPVQNVLALKQSTPTHLLDYFRTVFFAGVGTNYRSSERTSWTSFARIPTYRSINELKRVGIRAKKTDTATLYEITFKSFIFFGRLYLPKLVVDESIAPIFLNLIAYEMCPGFQNDFAASSYVAFLASLIHGPSDVKELKLVGVLQNAIGSDEQVAELFKTIASDLMPDNYRYAKVRDQMEIHYRRNWLYHFYSTEFSTEWGMIGSIAALVALVLTAIQTWFALPFNSRQA